ncbi:hypothetical protein [Xanthomonas citri]|uniref:hypothetical protein n=1 Tax=Xanthomonas citri TaxID=346 RepID=UPI001F15EE0D|nr:hypothetical protein [Xanthomonas citri]
MNRFKRDTGDVKREKPKPKRRKLNLTVALLPSLFFNDEEAMLTLTKKEGNPPPISRRQKWNFLVPFPEEVP